MYNTSDYVNVTLIANPCICPGPDNNFQVPAGCRFDTTCNLGTGNLSHTGTGTSECNTTFNLSNWDAPASGYIWNITGNCIMFVNG